jgi:hypothetical protein
VLVHGIQWVGGVVVAYAVGELVERVRARGRYPQPQGGDALAITGLGLGLILVLGVLSCIYVLPRFDDGSLIGLAITLGVPVLVGLAVQSSVWRAVCRRRELAANATATHVSAVTGPSGVD